MPIDPEDDDYEDVEGTQKHRYVLLVTLIRVWRIGGGSAVFGIVLFGIVNSNGV